MIAIEAITSALSYLALALVLGQLVVAGFLLPNGEPKELRRCALIFARSSLCIFLCSSTLALLIQGAKLQRGFPSAELLWRYVTAAQSGKVWLARELYAVALTMGMWFVIRQGAGIHSARLLTILALPLVASRSLTSHAVAVREDAALAVSSDALHLIVSALWAGGLLALWRALRLTTRESSQPCAWIVALVNRFSRLALVSVTLLGITGLYQSWIHVGSFTTLVNTDYGKVLLLKTLLFTLMVSFGALNFLSTRKILTRAVGPSENDQASRTKAFRRIGIESLIGVLIFCATGLLTVLPPGVHAVHQTAAAARAAQTEFTSPKKYLPAQGASVKILAPKSGAIVSADRMSIKFTLRAGQRGHHVHAYVDGELMGMFQSKTGTLNGLKPGRHILELRVVAEDHQSELDAFDQVEFTVN
jgi:putative copper export protein